MTKRELEEGAILDIQFGKRGDSGLVPVVTQDASSGEILMVAYANREAFEETLKSGLATYWSTSRNELWTKGKTSGDFLRIKQILVDCDQDALIYQVERLGKGACHTKNQQGESRRSCFYRRVQDGRLEFVEGEE
jgi:phosphoribosyl-AMP cyclohydrolase